LLPVPLIKAPDVSAAKYKVWVDAGYHKIVLIIILHQGKVEWSFPILLELEILKFKIVYAFSSKFTCVLIIDNVLDLIPLYIFWCYDLCEVSPKKLKC
jgi:hypothetical protein